MAPRTTKPKSEDVDPLKPKTEKAKVEKVKAAPKIKAEKTDKSTKVKVEKADKPKTEKKSGKEEKGLKEDKSKYEKGDKVKAVTGDEAVAIILEYLKSQNRPYSATEVSANLHGKVSHQVSLSHIDERT
jgi:hypothetical protein